MKTYRKSDSAENRNARKEIAARGGSRTPGSAFTLPAEQQLIYGRRLRRAVRNKRARLNIVSMTHDGHVLQPTLTMALPSDTRALLKAQFS